MNFSKKIIWFGSVFAFMYMFPVSFEIFQEQQKILMKIQMSQMMDGMGGDMGGGPAPVMRPFWLVYFEFNTLNNTINQLVFFSSEWSNTNAFKNGNLEANPLI